MKRFFAKIDPETCNPETCWLWTGAKCHDGYGRFRLGGRGSKMVAAHRFSYEHHVGPIPVGKQLLHSCDNPGCVNPNHLRIGTSKENTEDMILRGRNVFKTTRLHPCEVKAIRRIADETELTYTQIAGLFDIKSDTVSEIVARKTWRHL